MTVHANEEMAEDDLDILDIEEAVLNGRVVRRRDPLGPNRRLRVSPRTVNGS
jgi:hypothetical protein